MKLALGYFKVLDFCLCFEDSFKNQQLWTPASKVDFQDGILARKLSWPHSFLHRIVVAGIRIHEVIERMISYDVNDLCIELDST